MLHIQLEPEIRHALNMLKYLANHPDEFYNLLMPYAVVHMQIISCLFTEIVNIILICGQNTSQDTIVNYVALGAITQIDDYYFSSICEQKLKEFVEGEGVEITRKSKDYNKGPNGEEPKYKRNFVQKLIRANYNILRCIYATGYFYFTPYVTPVITYLVAGN